MNALAFISAVILLMAPASFADAQESNSMKENLYTSCLMSSEFESPYGESDLKGNQKLHEYCNCLTKEIAPKIEKAIGAAKESPGKARMLMQEMKETELATRNACRKKLKLPIVQAQ